MARWLLAAIGALIVLVVAALAAVPWLVDLPRVQAYVAHAVSQGLGRAVTFGSLSISAFPLPSMRLRDLQVAEDPRFGSGPFLTIREGRARIRLLPLLSRRLELAEVTLEGPRLEVIEQRGELNLAALGAAGPGAAASGPRTGSPGLAGGAAAVVVSRVKVVEGTVRYQKAGAAAFQLDGVTLTVRGGREAIEFSGQAAGEPGGLRLKISSGTVGLASGRSIGELPLKAAVAVEARDVGPLAAFVLATPSVAGPLSGSLELGGTTSRPSASGEVKFRELKLSQTRPQCPPPKTRELALRDVRVPVAWAAPARLDSAPLEARLAGGTVSLRLEAALEKSPVVTLRDIAVKGLELSAVLVDYLCQPYAVTGPLDLTGEVTLGTGAPLETARGSGRLRIGPGKVVGPEALGTLGDVARLAGVLSALLRPEGIASPSGSPLAFDSITGTYRIADGVVGTRDLLLQSPTLTVGAAGTYGLADGRVNLEVTVSQGRSQVRAKVVGTTAPRNLRIVPVGIQHGDRDLIRRSLEKLFR